LLVFPSSHSEDVLIVQLRTTLPYLLVGSRGIEPHYGFTIQEYPFNNELARLSLHHEKVHYHADQKRNVLGAGCIQIPPYWRKNLSFCLNAHSFLILTYSYNGEHWCYSYKSSLKG